MPVESSDPIYPISVAAKLLEVHPRTLRIYEEEGLVSPSRKGQKRFFSNDDIEWIQCLRDLIHEQGISIPGIKKLLELTPCWEINHCPPEKRDACSAFVDNTIPCWERDDLACAREPGRCQNCDFFIKAMKNVRKKAREQQEMQHAQDSVINK
ncbi:MAG TPA: MerR family transcriptional regulator [Geopsychrobacteraceae bacterium]|jgi:MerR family transcriptional regulator/heat shock protein HspR